MEEDRASFIIFSLKRLEHLLLLLWRLEPPYYYSRGSSLVNYYYGWGSNLINYYYFWGSSLIWWALYWLLDLRQCNMQNLFLLFNIWFIIFTIEAQASFMSFSSFFFLWRPTEMRWMPFLPSPEFHVAMHLLQLPTPAHRWRMATRFVSLFQHNFIEALKKETLC